MRRIQRRIKKHRRSARGTQRTRRTARHQQECNSCIASIELKLLIFFLVKVESFRDLGNLLGKSKNLGMGTGTLPPETVFGCPSAGPHSAGAWGAAKTIKGEYSDNDARIDPDLGCSITPGFRNITSEVRGD